MSPLTSSKESFKAVVFKGRNSSKYKLMEIQEDPLAILVLKKIFIFPIRVMAILLHIQQIYRNMMFPWQINHFPSILTYK